MQLWEHRSHPGAKGGHQETDSVSRPGLIVFEPERDALKLVPVVGSEDVFKLGTDGVQGSKQAF